MFVCLLIPSHGSVLRVISKLTYVKILCEVPYFSSLSWQNKSLIFYAIIVIHGYFLSHLINVGDFLIMPQLPSASSGRNFPFVLIMAWF